MSLRPHFIKISDVLVRGIARSTVKREMLRSLRHIAETIDAVMIAEGIENIEDVIALRDLGLRYGQGYYMARPGPGFPTLRAEVRAELRNVMVAAPATVLVTTDDDDDDDEDDEDDEDDDRDLVSSVSSGPPRTISSSIPRNAFGRPEDEITSDFAIPGLERPRPRASEPPNEPAPSHSAGATTNPVPMWQPLSDDEATGEALLSSLKRQENSSEGEPGAGGPGLN
jgi:hypothetical protein